MSSRIMYTSQSLDVISSSASIVVWRTFVQLYFCLLDKLFAIIFLIFLFLVCSMLVS